MGQITRTNFGLAATKLFTNAQVLAWVTTPLTLVAGIAGRVFLPQFCAIALFPRVADYTNIDGGATITVKVGGAGGVVQTNAFTPATVLAGADGARFIQQSVLNFVSDDFTLMNGAAVTLVATNAAAGNFTGGDAGNIFRVTLFYSELLLVP